MPKSTPKKTAALSALSPELKRIKRMYSRLAKEALGHLGSSPYASWHASAGLMAYSERYSAWAHAVSEHSLKKTPAASAKAEGRFRKLAEHHNRLVVLMSDESVRAASKSRGNKLAAEIEAARATALKRQGLI